MVLITFLFLEYQRWQLIQHSLNPKEINQLKIARTPLLIEVVKTEVIQANILYIQEALKNSYRRQHLLKTPSKINVVA